MEFGQPFEMFQPCIGHIGALQVYANHRLVWILAANPNGGPASVGPATDPDYVSHVVSRIGEAAGVKVDVKRKAGKGEVVKYAGCHDLRRSFGFRWSRRVMPPQLQKLTRHESVETSMRFYVVFVAEDALVNCVWLWRLVF